MSDLEIDRREALYRLGLISLAGMAGCKKATSSNQSQGTVHPHIFIRGDKQSGLRSVEGVRKSIETGIPKQMWDLIRTECDAEIGSETLTARSIVEGRSASQAEQNNPDYVICAAAGQRILRNALALLMTSNEDYKQTALEQIWTLVDESVFPDWIDQAHLRFEHPADLRTGMLSQDVGIGYDWLYPFLNAEEKERIIEGLDRRGIQPFLTSMSQDPWWSHDLNNWYTVIIGGLGVAGMALGNDHPQSQDLIDLSLGKMRDYLSIYGEGGEFNESVAYSNATRIPVTYFFAYYYHMAGGSNPLKEHPFPQTGEWTVYSTLPPGRYAAFGDGWIGQPPMVEFMTAIAAASRNSVLQGFAKRHLEANSNPYLLLWFDPDLESESPEGRWPRGRAFTDNAAQIYSRTDWNPERTAMVVYGKAKRDHNHAHNDVGQVCIDAEGKRMIIDPGSPSAYPADFFDENRWKYYNASARGHNVPMFGGREQRFTPHTRGVKTGIDWDSVNGRYLQSHFEEENGGYWQLDLTNAYDGVKSVKRTVVHLFPGFVAVLDEGQLETKESISLRWHTIEPAKLDIDGGFHFSSEGVGMSGQIAVLSGKLEGHQSKRHAYEAPYHKDRVGDLLEQRREAYIETTLTDEHYRVLTLFSLGKNDWFQEGDYWQIQTGDSDCKVSLSDSQLKVFSSSEQRSFEVQL